MNVNYIRPKATSLLTNVGVGTPFLRPSDSDLYIKTYSILGTNGLSYNAVILRSGSPVALDPMMEVTICDDAQVTRKQ